MFDYSVMCGEVPIQSWLGAIHKRGENFTHHMQHKIVGCDIDYVHSVQFYFARIT